MSSSASRSADEDVRAPSEMKIAVLNDIHGNLPALEAVLAEVALREVDAIVVGGDVVAGPFPSATLALLRALETPTTLIHGNAESETLRFARDGVVDGLVPADLIQWVAEKLRDDQLAWIGEWPLTAQIGTTLFCHATPQDDVTVFTKLTSDENVREKIGAISAEIQTIICGHTHIQFDRIVDGIRIVNAGSIGMPFGEGGAHWLLIDGDALYFQRTMYDVDEAAEQIRTSDYPQAEQFATGNVLSVPTFDAAYAMLNGLE